MQLTRHEAPSPLSWDVLPAAPSPTTPEPRFSSENTDTPGNHPASKYHPSTCRGLPEWPRHVGVGMKIENILSVDTAECNFAAMFKLSLEWQLTSQEHKDWLAGGWGREGRRPPWEPRIALPTVQKVEHKEELPVPFTQHTTVFDVFTHEGMVFVVVYLRYRCVFSETYELQNFPFDCQDLSLVIESMDPSRVLLMPRVKRCHFASIALGDFSLVEWDLRAPMVTVTRNGAKSRRTGLTEASRFIMQVKMKRRSQSYVSRVLYLAGLLTFGSLLTWSIDVHLPHRLILCFTILLTLVAFQMAISNKLPKVRYLTLLDKYLVLGQRFMLFVAIEHAVLKKLIEHEPKLDWVDDACACVSASVYVFMNIAYCLLVRRRGKDEEEKLTLCSPLLEQWLAKRQQSEGRRDWKVSSEQQSKGEVSGCSFQSYTASIVAPETEDDGDSMDPKDREGCSSFRLRKR